MNNLLFTALLVALLYYFFIYLPNQKKLSNSHSTKLTHSQSTQTDPYPITTTKNDEPGMIKCPGPITEPKEIKELKKDILQKEKTIIGLNNSYNKLETQKNKEIDNLKEQLKEKDNKVKELLEVEKQVDNLTKNIQDLNKELD